MKPRFAVQLALLIPACLLAAGCLLLPQSPASGASPNELVPALVVQPHEEEPEPSAEQLRELSPEERAVYEVYRRVNRGVVNITSLSVRYNWFLQAVPQEGTGSGSILDSQGNVLTNYHVVKGAERLYITLYDGSNFEARVVGTDPENDLAVARFDPAGRELVTMPLGVSRSLVVGQKLIALGNPFGLERTLTTGVVSGLRRPLATAGGFIIRELIQTDAAINPGNSGGPLLNLKGEMVGINTMILAPAGGNAEKAGLRGGSADNYLVSGGRTIFLGGDIILSIDGQAVWTLMDLLGVLESTRPGQTAALEVLRGG